MAEIITYQGKNLELHKTTVNPDWGIDTVLVTSTWDYVALWLKREGHGKEALLYWEQAKSFFEATKILPKTSAPLTAYYCFLNAVKCLLTVKGVVFTERHGISGWNKTGKVSLSKELVNFQNSGILSSLCSYLGEPVHKNVYSLKDIFYNLSCIHRAYHLTFVSEQELFTPIKNPSYVRAPASKKSWFTAVIDDQDVHAHTLALLPNGYERDMGDPSVFRIRRKKRFDWIRGPANKADNINRLNKYHLETRRNLFYIYSPSRLWYIKRKKSNLQNVIDRSNLPLIFSAMHRLSELARYTPDYLAKHFDSQHNWLLSEFIEVSPSQFIDEISSEITGREFMIPRRSMI